MSTTYYTGSMLFRKKKNNYFNSCVYTWLCHAATANYTDNFRMMYIMQLVSYPCTYNLYLLVIVDSCHTHLDEPLPVVVIFLLPSVHIVLL